jgi:hypothetical protein
LAVWFGADYQGKGKEQRETRMKAKTDDVLLSVFCFDPLSSA